MEDAVEAGASAGGWGGEFEGEAEDFFALDEDAGEAKETLVDEEGPRVAVVPAFLEGGVEEEIGWGFEDREPRGVSWVVEGKRGEVHGEDDGVDPGGVEVFGAVVRLTGLAVGNGFSDAAVVFCCFGLIGEIELGGSVEGHTRENRAIDAKKTLSGSGSGNMWLRSSSSSLESNHEAMIRSSGSRTHRCAVDIVVRARAFS